MKQTTKQSVVGLVGMLVASGILIGGVKTYETKKELAEFGHPKDITALNKEGYGVSRAWTRDDGSYLIEATAKGFQSDITMLVHFDAAADTILDVKVAKQGDTAGIGSQIAEDSFAQKFTGIATPISMGKLQAVSPVTGAAVKKLAHALVLGDANQWNPEDKSPEAEAYRKLYEAGLLKSSLEGRELATPEIDMTDAQKKENAGKESPFVEQPSYPEPTEVDAITGATISSSGAAAAINNSFFFMKEEILK